MSKTCVTTPIRTARGNGTSRNRVAVPEIIDPATLEANLGLIYETIESLRKQAAQLGELERSLKDVTVDEADSP